MAGYPESVLVPDVLGLVLMQAGGIIAGKEALLRQIRAIRYDTTVGEYFGHDMLETQIVLPGWTIRKTRYGDLPIRKAFMYSQLFDFKCETRGQKVLSTTSHGFFGTDTRFHDMQKYSWFKYSEVQFAVLGAG